MAVCDVAKEGLRLIERAKGVTVQEIIEATAAPLILPDGELPVF